MSKLLDNVYNDRKAYNDFKGRGSKEKRSIKKLCEENVIEINSMNEYYTPKYILRLQKELGLLNFNNKVDKIYEGFGDNSNKHIGSYTYYKELTNLQVLTSNNAENGDFFKCRIIEDRLIPLYSNPPFSNKGGQNIKEKIFLHALHYRKPFCLLLPTPTQSTKFFYDIQQSLGEDKIKVINLVGRINFLGLNKQAEFVNNKTITKNCSFFCYKLEEVLEEKQVEKIFNGQDIISILLNKRQDLEVKKEVMKYKKDFKEYYKTIRNRNMICKKIFKDIIREQEEAVLYNMWCNLQQYGIKYQKEYDLLRKKFCKKYKL